jgi:DNA (cytosine-5)-methyltransferase 1
MNHQDKLLEIYKSISDNSHNSKEIISETLRISEQILNSIKLVAVNCSNQKGVYTVLMTLLTHKYLFPHQDVRFHQQRLPNGFSGRTIDTQYITPTLKSLGLPSMAESGWLTRSLEQPFPYTMEYQGKIGGKGVKNAFLSVLNFLEVNTIPVNQKKVAELLLFYLLKNVIELSTSEKLKFAKIPELSSQMQKKVEFKINDIISYLQEHFYWKYTTKGVSKLPVIAIYAIYELLIKEIVRYKNCILKPLGSHTASDRTSRSAGDIEIYSTEPENYLLEVIEIKYEKLIDKHMVAIAREKILRFSPERYLILSSANIKKEDEIDINQMIDEILDNHQCQVIVNGIFPTLKYYLRLVSSVTEFINHYSDLLEKDREINFEHKQKWAEILEKIEIK